MTRFEIKVIDATLERLACVTWEGLTEPERNLVAIRVWEDEVYNGGLDQFFGNSSGDHALQALQGLQAVGAVQAASLFGEAIRLFPGQTVPMHHEQRRAALDELAPEAIVIRDGLCRQITEDPDHLGDLLSAYVQVHDADFLGPRTALALWHSVRARGGDTRPSRVHPIDWAQAEIDDRPSCIQPCPECGYPSPAYRDHCKRCGFPYSQQRSPRLVV